MNSPIRPRTTFLLLAAIGMFSAFATPPLLSAAPDWIWWEAESTSATNFPAPTSEGDLGEKIFSGGKWIGVGPNPADPHPEPLMFLEYKVNVPETGDYEFIARKFGKHGPFRWRFDNQPWQTLDRDTTVLLDRVELLPKWGISWVPVGHAKLEAGEHTLRIELTENPGVGYFDAFVLTRSDFTPRGRLKPDAPYPEPPEGWFNFVRSPDSATKPVLNLRFFNEKEAGEGGFIQAKGEEFIHGGTGETVRFWAVNVGPATVSMPHDYVDRLANFLASRGVNLVRLHGPLYEGSGPSATRIDEAYLDKVLYFIAALQRAGIYSHLSIHFQHWLNLSETAEFPNYKPSMRPYAIHFFDPAFQAVMKGWWTKVLTDPNPYDGGRRLVDNPALMGVELVNEDSFFWMSFNYGFAPRAIRETLEKQYHEFLIRKYGSLDAARAAWGPGAGIPEDEKALEGLAVTTAYQLRKGKNTTFGQRHLDAVAFLAGTQSSFFSKMRDHLKQEVGFKGVVCSSNWKTADDATLGPVEKLTNLGTDFMDYHGYFSAPHIAKTNPAVLSAGDIYADRSLLRLDPGKSRDKKKGFLGERSFDPSFIDIIYNGQPSMVSEFTYMGQNRFRGEMPLLTAALAGQAGMDAPVFFMLNPSPGWQSSVQNLWPLNSPADIGQFPAAALIFRRGDVKETSPAAHVTLNREDVMDLKGSPIVTANMQDANRTGEGGEAGSIQSLDHTLINQKVFAIGKVAMDILPGRKTEVKVVDLAKYDNSAAKLLKGLGGQTVWDYGRGIYDIRTPRAQASIGFLGARNQEDLGDIIISVKNEYATVAVVSLDDKPISTSGSLLVQAFTEQRNTGFADQPVTEGPGAGGREILRLGEAPLQLREIEAAITFKRADAARLMVTPCDFDGRPLTPPVPLGSSTLTLQPRVFFYHITTS